MDAREYAAEVAKAIEAEMMGFRVRRFRQGERARIEVRIESRGTLWTLGRKYLAPHEGSAPPAVEARRIINEFHRAKAAKPAGGAP